MMSAVFTQHAIDRMDARASRPEEQAELADLVAAVEDVSRSPARLGSAPNTARLYERRGETMYVVRSGRARAVLVTDQAAPDRIVVANVYWADEEEPGGSLPLETAIGRAGAAAG